jgi:hypothetical protein
VVTAIAANTSAQARPSASPCSDSARCAAMPTPRPATPRWVGRGNGTGARHAGVTLAL